MLVERRGGGALGRVGVRRELDRVAGHFGVAGAPPSEPPFDLDAELRPALARVSERLIDRWLELPPHPDAAEVRRETSETLAPAGLPPEIVDAIAAAIAE